MSLWPVRTGVLVEDGIAYFWAGLFPSQGLHFYAVGAADGKLVWQREGGGKMSPQGYMLASTWLQAPPPSGPNHNPGGYGSPDDPGIRWWLEFLQRTCGPYVPASDASTLPQ